MNTPVRTVLVLASVALALPASASAAFPGKSGDIAFGRTFKHGFEIFSSNPRTGKTQRLTSKAILDGETMAAGHPSFGPDGRRIVFTNSVRTKASGGRRNDVYVMRSDGSHYKRLTHTEGGEYLPSFTADGRKVAYSYAGKTYLVRANGRGGRTELTAALANGGVGATFSPDGSKVAVTSSEGGDSDIVVINADGSDPVNVTAASAADEYSPDFSPDGTRIAFISNRDDTYGDLYTMAANGSDVRTVVANEGIETDAPAYSPDGRQIALQTRKSTRAAVEVFTVGADGGDLSAVQRGLGINRPPVHVDLEVEVTRSAGGALGLTEPVELLAGADALPLITRGQPPAARLVGCGKRHRSAPHRARTSLDPPQPSCHHRIDVTEAEFRDFIREQTLRHERATRSVERWMQGVERRVDEMVRRSDAQIATLEDLVQESRAQREALFTVIDRLDSGGPPPAAA